LITVIGALRAAYHDLVVQVSSQRCSLIEAANGALLVIGAAPEASRHRMARELSVETASCRCAVGVGTVGDVIAVVVDEVGAILIGAAIGEARAVGIFTVHEFVAIVVLVVVTDLGRGLIALTGRDFGRASALDALATGLLAAVRSTLLLAKRVNAIVEVEKVLD